MGACRAGRSERQSYCYLVYSKGSGATARKKMRVGRMGGGGAVALRADSSSTGLECCRRGGSGAGREATGALRAALYRQRSSSGASDPQHARAGALPPRPRCWRTAPTALPWLSATWS